MKSAYELAMERLAKESPIDSITDEQKKAIAEIDKKYSSKIAEREVFLKSKIAEAMSNGEFEEAQQQFRHLLAQKVQRLMAQQPPLGSWLCQRRPLLQHKRLRPQRPLPFVPSPLMALQQCCQSKRQCKISSESFASSLLFTLEIQPCGETPY